MTAVALKSFQDVPEREYKRRIRAWTMYDWANSAFATTVLAAILPVYFSQVAGATLPSAAVATAYWSTGLSISLILVAIISPVLGTVSDIIRGKKRFLALFAGVGIVSVALLVFVETGDWMLAAIFGIVGRIGFSGANVFYDALLPHVAKQEDRDKVSTRGYAMGYLGGGLLLAINVVMLLTLPGTWGSRLSFLSVAIWWMVFSIPLFVRVPEPPAAEVVLEKGLDVVTASFRRLGETLKDLRRYSELFKFLIAFLIYNDGIGTIIGVAAIYGAELGFGAVELVLAILLVQFVGIPFSLIFGRLPDPGETRRPFFLAFIIFNIIALPLAGGLGTRLLPEMLVGAKPAPYEDTFSAFGEGIYPVTIDSDSFDFSGDWRSASILGDELGDEEDASYAVTSEIGAGFEFPFNGSKTELTYSKGPDHGIWAVYLDDEPLINPETNEAVLLDAFNPTVRYRESFAFEADQPGEHTLLLVNTSGLNPASRDHIMSVEQLEVHPAVRQSDLRVILAALLMVQVLGLIFALVFGKPLFSGLAASMDTKRSILLALTVYIIIAAWGFFLDAVIEFWFIAWMVAVVQGGSQALSRSLYSAMSPASKSGEFFGFFGVMEKFSTLLGPIVFAAAALTFGSSRPAILSLILFFVLGGLLLTRVDVEKGRRIAATEDSEIALT